MDTSGLAFPKTRPRILDRIQRKTDLDRQMRMCRKAVQARDKGRCVVPACKGSGSHKHHIQFRSQGGRWQTSNVCSLCPLHHQLLHAGLIQIAGNADEHLTITGDQQYLKGPRC